MQRRKFAARFREFLGMDDCDHHGSADDDSMLCSVQEVADCEQGAK